MSLVPEGIQENVSKDRAVTIAAESNQEMNHAYSRSLFEDNPVKIQTTATNKSGPWLNTGHIRDVLPSTSMKPKDPRNSNKKQRRKMNQPCFLGGSCNVRRMVQDPNGGQASIVAPPHFQPQRLDRG